MIRKLEFTAFFLTLGSVILFAKHNTSHRNLLNIEIDTVWQKSNSNNEIKYFITDTFYVCEDLSPLRRPEFFVYPLDTVSFTIRTEPNWSKQMMDSIQRHNKKVFVMIQQKLLAHYGDGEEYFSKLVQN